MECYFQAIQLFDFRFNLRKIINFVNSLYMPNHVYLLLRTIGTIETLEPSLLSAFPLLVVAQRTSQLVQSSAFVTRKSSPVFYFRRSSKYGVHSQFWQHCLFHVFPHEHHGQCEVSGPAVQTVTC